MATGVQVSVGTSATKLADEAGTILGLKLRIANRGSASVFLGGSAVTTGTGFELKTTDPPLSVDLTGSDETLYAICAAATQRVDVLAI